MHVTTSILHTHTHTHTHTHLEDSKERSELVASLVRAETTEIHVQVRIPDCGESGSISASVRVIWIDTASERIDGVFQR